jgi:hypothetical protein
MRNAVQIASSAGLLLVPDYKVSVVIAGCVLLCATSGSGCLVLLASVS